ncbi:hypothetical protein ABZ612_31450 [Streptomyces avermitilis]|uniref:hypothetical protein n=1 Tax=Streptomyces avermitilis TaxID=33903 RepID=UPI0034009F53
MRGTGHRARTYELAVRSVVPGATVGEPDPCLAHAAVHHFPWEDGVVVGHADPDRSRVLDAVVELNMHGHPAITCRSGSTATSIRDTSSSGPALAMKSMCG